MHSLSCLLSLILYSYLPSLFLPSPHIQMLRTACLRPSLPLGMLTLLPFISTSHLTLLPCPPFSPAPSTGRCISDSGSYSPLVSSLSPFLILRSPFLFLCLSPLLHIVAHGSRTLLLPLPFSSSSSLPLSPLLSPSSLFFFLLSSLSSPLLLSSCL